MCGRFIQYSDPEVYAACFDLELDLDPGRGAAEPTRRRFNLAPTQMAYVIRAGADGRRHLDLLRWGLIPFWSKGPDNRYQMINARAETVADKPAYRAAFRARRCLVPAEGFYEWRTQGRLKQPYLIRRAEPVPFAMAGLWEHWRDRGRPGGEEIHSFTLIVTDANAAIRPLHDRMPVVLPPEHYATWLDQGERDTARLLALLQPAPADGWALEPVSTRVNSPRDDDAALMEPIAPDQVLLREPLDSRGV